MDLQANRLGKAENTNDKQNSGSGGSISMDADPCPRWRHAAGGRGVDHWQWQHEDPQRTPRAPVMRALDGFRPGHGQLDVAGARTTAFLIDLKTQQRPARYSQHQGRASAADCKRTEATG